MMRPARLRSALERLSLVRVLFVLGIVLVAINIAAAIWDAYSDRQRVFRDVQRDVSNITSLLSEQTAAGLEAADLVLRDVQRMGTAADVARAESRLRDQLAHAPQIAALLIFDEQGRIVARTNETPVIDTSGRPRPFVDAHAEGKATGLYVSEPYVGGQATDRSSWRFVLSRRLSGPGGAYAGVVAALIEVETYERLYRSIDLGKGGFISLLSAEGTVITRVPDPRDLKGSKIGANELLDAVRRDGRVDGRVTSEVLKEPVLLSIARVRGGFPLFVTSGKTERAALDAWRTETRVTAERTILTSAAMLALIGLAAWGLNRRERELKANEKRFRAMIERSSDAVVLNNPRAGGILYTSPGFERILGHDAAEMRGRSLLELIHPEQHAAAAAQRADVLDTPGKTATGEYRMRHRDGSYRWVEATLTNLLHEPAVGAAVINLRDITERKLAEAERARLETRLRQAAKMEAVGRLAGGIAHDFNNILGGILGYAEMLVESAREGTPERRYAQNVLTAGERASALVEQILTYSRSQRGKRVAVDLGGIVAETVDLVRGSLSPGIELQASLPPRPLHVMADPTQVHQIVMNLCTNALHAIGERGTMRVTVQAVENGAERVFPHTTLAPGQYALLKVEDSGRGMDAQTISRLFEPFFTTKEVGKGTGLGLSLVYGIVTDSGGAIDVASTPGKGSCFAAYLPLVEAPEAAADDSRAPVLRGAGERVLVVDDDPVLLAVTAEILKRLGYDASAYADGAVALAACEAASPRFDVVIADEVMPGLSGTELAGQLRRRCPGLPVLLVSGYIGPMMTERALAAGVSEILKKPVQSRELAAALARALGKASALG